MQAHSLTASGGGLTIPRTRKLLAAFGDERLVEQVRRGNEAAFEVLYDRHHGAVLSYCRHMLGSRDEGEDALQQEFISAHAGIVSSAKPIRFKPWLYTIARNRCLSILRARREQPSDTLDPVSTAGLGEQVQQRADLTQLLTDMQDLPEEQRAALILSELGDLSHQEVAEVIGCEAAKVKSLVFQARAGLIERREGRETPCEEIREQLATLRGGSLRRGPLRRHVKACPGCSEFRDQVRRQRQMMAVVLPVIPTLGLKESALAAVGVGSAGGGALIGGGTGAVVAAKTGIAKVAVIALATSGAVGGAVAVQQTGRDHDPSRGAAGQSERAPAAGAAGVGALEDPSSATGARDAEDRAKDKAGATGNRGENARAEKQGERGERKRGFEPVPGGSNGERAREFARGRGNGRHRGLDKQAAREGNGKKPHPKKPKPAPGSRRPETRPAPPAARRRNPLAPIPPGAQRSPRAERGRGVPDVQP